MPAEPGDVVALTALDVEFEALSEQLLDTTQLPPTASGTCYGLGSVRGPAGNWRVTVAEIGEGNLGAAAECQRAITRVRPQLILFVGIAGSLRPDEIQAGDVVVATKVATGPGGRDDGRFHAQPTTYPCSYRVIQLARMLRRTSEREAWLRRLDPAPTRPPHVHLKPVAAVDEVVASDASAIRAFLAEYADDAVAVGMESAGMLKAANDEQVPAGVIRGISDLLVDRGRADRGERQRVAARTAAAFAVELLGRLAPRSPSPSRAEQAADPGTVGRPQRHRQPDRRIKAVICNEQQVGNNVINYGAQAPSDDR